MALKSLVNQVLENCKRLIYDNIYLILHLKDRKGNKYLYSYDGCSWGSGTGTYAQAGEDFAIYLLEGCETLHGNFYNEDLEEQEIVLNMLDSNKYYAKHYSNVLDMLKVALDIEKQEAHKCEIDFAFSFITCLLDKFCILDEVPRFS